MVFSDFLRFVLIASCAHGQSPRLPSGVVVETVVTGHRVQLAHLLHFMVQPPPPPFAGPIS